MTQNDDANRAFENQLSALQDQQRAKGRRPPGLFNRMKDWWNPQPPTEISELQADSERGFVSYKHRDRRPLLRRCWDGFVRSLWFAADHPAVCFLLLVALVLMAFIRFFV